MTEIWRTRDRVGREVVFTTARLDHVLQDHDEMADRLDEVRTTIEQPDLLARDGDYRHRENHYRRASSERNWIKVVQYRPVPPQGTWAGEVIIAYRVKRPDPQEEPLPS